VEEVKYERGPHQTEAARWGWCRYDEARVTPRRPPPMAYEGACWHGWHEESQLNVAIRRAAETLPEDLRDAATMPAEKQGPASE
jgi:hypothetical protein